MNEFKNQEKIILRDYLALERTRLANERTLFSYIRTSLYLLTVGMGILEIKSIEHLRSVAWICLVVSIILFVIGVYRYYQLKKYLNTYSYKESGSIFCPLLYQLSYGTIVLFNGCKGRESFEYSKCFVKKMSINFRGEMVCKFFCCFI